jgi:hypothetical protein
MDTRFGGLAEGEIRGHPSAGAAAPPPGRRRPFRAPPLARAAAVRQARRLTPGPPPKSLAELRRLAADLVAHAAHGNLRDARKREISPT